MTQCSVSKYTVSNEMSFKLVDNKGSSDVRQHNKRRADELILELIPSTEYIVNRSGKFCCKVCPQWPVFDTPVMLKRHRESRRHARSNEDWERACLNKVLSDPVDEHRGDKITEIDPKVLLANMQTINAGNMMPQDEKTREPSNMMISTLEESTINCTELRKSKKKKWVPFFQTRHEAVSTKLKIKMEETSKSTVSIAKCKRGSEQDMKKEENNEIYCAKRKKQKLGKTVAKQIVMGPCKEQTTSTIDSVDLKMKYYSKMKQSGWVLDSEGKWKRDDDCEFDSDEEPPKFAEFEKWDR